MKKRRILGDISNSDYNANDIKEETYDVCLLVEKSDAFTEDLTKILADTYKLNVWPHSVCIHAHFCKIHNVKDKGKSSKENIDETRNKISASSIVIAILTNDFMQHNDSLELVTYARDTRKPVIGLAIENLVESRHEAALKGFDSVFDLSKERTDPIGYDKYIWIGDGFSKILEYVGTKLRKKFTKPRNKNKVFHIYSINNQNDLNDCLSIWTLICSVLGEGHEIPNINLPEDHYNTQGVFNYYSDLTKYDIASKLGKEFDYKRKATTTALTDYCDAKLEYANVANKSDYLNLIQAYECLLQTKAAEFLKNKEEIRSKLKGKCKRFFGTYIYLRITYSGPIKNCDFEDAVMILQTMEDEFKKNNLDIWAVENAMHFISEALSDCIYEEFQTSKLIVLLLTKLYSETNKFKLLFQKLIKEKKQIYVIKLDDDIDLGDISAKIAERVHIYDMYKHKGDSFDGYITRKLLDDIRSSLNVKHSTKPIKFILHNDLFICNQDDAYSQYFNDLYAMFNEQKFDVKLGSEMKYKELIDFKDRIEKSKILLFVLTNKFYESIEFDELIEEAKRGKKTAIFILVEKITSKKKQLVDITKFNCIEIYKNFNKNGESIWHGELFYRLCYFFYSTFCRQDLLTVSNNHYTVDLVNMQNAHTKPFDDKLHRYRPSIQSITLKKKLQINAALYSFLIFKEKLYVTGNSYLFIYDLASFQLLKQIPLSIKRYSRIKGILYHNKSESIFMVDAENLFSLNKEGNIVDLKNFKELGKIESFVYDEASDGLYLLCNNNKIIQLDNEFNCIRRVDTGVSYIKSFKLINRHLLMLTCKNVTVYDLELTHASVFGEPILSSPSGAMFNDNNGNIYIFESQLPRCFKIFNRGFKYIGFVKFDYFYNEATLVNGDLMFLNNNEFYIYEVKYMKYDVKTASDEYYVCKMNPNNHHVSRNPYELPCGNVACLECIYDNYNLYTNQFMCNFDACKVEHNLNGEIKQLFLSDDNLKKICRKEIESINKYPNTTTVLDEKLECFENLFKFVEEEIEVRIESLNVQIDELQEKAIKCVDRTEEKLLKKSKSSKKERVVPKTKRARMSKSTIKVGTRSPAKNFPFKTHKRINKDHVGRIVNDEPVQSIIYNSVIEFETDEEDDDDDDDDDEDDFYEDLMLMQYLQDDTDSDY